MRHLLAAESAANDGLALPLVQLPILFFLYAGRCRVAIDVWFYDAWARQVGLSVAIGLVCGAALALLFNTGMEGRLWGKEAQASTLLAMALSITGALEAIGSDGILGAFCGIAFGTLQVPEGANEIMAREFAINGLEVVLTFLFFIFFGAVMPWAAWQAIGWGYLVAFAVSVSLLRRVPVILLARALRLLPVFTTWRESLLAGWLGPVGVAAVFWAALASIQLGPAFGGEAEAVYNICTFVVLAHVVLYSVSGPLVGRAYALYEAQYVIPVQGIRTVPSETEHLEFGVWPPTSLGRGLSAWPFLRFQSSVVERVTCHNGRPSKRVLLLSRQMCS